MAEARALFRSFLRVAHAWNAEPSRPGRNLKEAILQRTRVHFRQQQTASASDVPTLLQHGRLELTALQQLLSNQYRDEASLFFSTLVSCN